MTSIYVIVSIKLCLKVGKDEYIVESIFGGRRISGFEVIGGGGGLRGPPFVVVWLFVFNTPRYARFSKWSKFKITLNTYIKQTNKQTNKKCLNK